MDWWPQCEWKTIHNVAACLGEGDEENFITWIELTMKLLCCGKCKKNAAKELKELPIRDYIYAKVSKELFVYIKIKEGSTNKI